MDQFFRRPISLQREQPPGAAPQPIGVCYALGSFTTPDKWIAGYRRDRSANCCIANVGRMTGHRRGYHDRKESRIYDHKDKSRKDAERLPLVTADVVEGPASSLLPLPRRLSVNKRPIFVVGSDSAHTQEVNSCFDCTDCLPMFDCMQTRRSTAGWSGAL